MLVTKSAPPSSLTYTIPHTNQQSAFSPGQVQGWGRPAPWYCLQLSLGEVWHPHTLLCTDRKLPSLQSQSILWLWVCQRVFQYPSPGPETDALGDPSSCSPATGTTKTFAVSAQSRFKTSTPYLWALWAPYICLYFSPKLRASRAPTCSPVWQLELSLPTSSRQGYSLRGSWSATLSTCTWVTWTTSWRNCS